MIPATTTEEFVRETVELSYKHKRQIKVSYLDKKGNAENRLIEVLELHEKNFGAFCHLRGGYRSFSYGRVMRIVLTDVPHEKTIEMFTKDQS